ncbi:hypothetical protein ACR8AL_03625 [Clavibacter sepedonicus]|uniref:Antitoxin n=1 Tax=Clavibacter sepedonicus TaxID=31964 RepID=B0RBV7_CLASE|nr:MULTISPECIES: hypothetical protein [Clavibacter]MBD5380904.1 hypothetical protein [Clavibacter sp.]UUK65266.1 hypothetical protein LRE50_13440 [Clavibacter sepedonicus]CAQ00508.1 conserved hypothetical protein [Clavibacter sepedonicus]
MSEHDETSYLLRNPVGAKRLIESLERARREEFVERELIEPTDTEDPHDSGE